MKFKEIKEKKADELNQLEGKLRHELAEMRLMSKSGQLAQVSKLTTHRRDIARVLTARNAKPVVKKAESASKGKA